MRFTPYYTDGKLEMEYNSEPQPLQQPQEINNYECYYTDGKLEMEYANILVKFYYKGINILKSYF